MLLDNGTEDYVGDYNIQKLAYIGINAINYLHARKLLHAISKDVNCDDPIETVMNADKLASAIQYNKMEPAKLKKVAEDDIDEDDVNYLLATL